MFPCSFANLPSELGPEFTMQRLEDLFDLNITHRFEMPSIFEYALPQGGIEL